MQSSSKPFRGWLIASHAAAFILGAAGIIVVREAPARTVVVKPTVDLGSDELMPLMNVLGPASLEMRMQANENAAIATLRSIAAAQQMFQSSCAIDTDADGGGEFGFFGELAGAAAMRVHGPTSDRPELGSAPDDLLDPPFLATQFGALVADRRGDGIVERTGYCYKIYLPGPTTSGATSGLGEDTTGGTKSADMGASWGSSNCEIFWCAYAWPADTEATGSRAFMINQECEILQCDNSTMTYEGLTSTPSFCAAYSDATPDDMGEYLGLSVMGFTANDGNLWTTVGY